MAVKKATAKKPVAKKAAAKAPKKSTTKKSTVKKSAVKKSAKKKATSKATTVKKSAVKKSAVKKSAVKKSAAKKPTTTVKKRTTKKATRKKIAPRKGAETIFIPEAPIPASRNARVEIVSTPAAPTFVATAPTSSALAAPSADKKPGASGRVIFAVVVGIILLGVIVWAKGHNSTKTPVAAPTATASQTPSSTPSASPTPSASDTSVALTAHEAPQGVVAHYTTTGATIFWKAPIALEGLTGYNIEISVSNGPWKLISTVPATQFSLDVKKESATGWTSFKVSSVYSDSETNPAKAFGLPGTYS